MNDFMKEINDCAIKYKRPLWKLIHELHTNITSDQNRWVIRVSENILENDFSLAECHDLQQYFGQNIGHLGIKFETVNNAATPLVIMGPGATYILSRESNLQEALERASHHVRGGQSISQGINHGSS